LVALKWEDVHADSVTIDERFCRGAWASPKTNASGATIGVDESVTQRIHPVRSRVATESGGADDGHGYGTPDEGGGSQQRRDQQMFNWNEMERD
jgi:hypothetical protein